MRTFLVGTWILMSAFLVGPAPAAAQLSANVQISWHWSDGGWRSSDVRYEAVPVRARMAPDPRTGLRVPPGHMPPPGMCRVWIVGVPPGHQPPPQSCARAFRSHRNVDAIILHSPGRYERDGRDRHGRDRDRWEDWDDDWDDERWDHREDKRGPDRGRPGGSGRGGR